MKTYKINEIFYSLQGEGNFTGWPVVFIRFSGCNRKCTVKSNGFDCDTKHESGEQYTAYQIVDEIKKLTKDCKRIVATGGEPLLQLDEELVDLLHENNFYVHVETNGSIIPSFKDKLDWVTVSPKEKDWALKTGQELKVVYVGQDLESYLISNFNYYYLQPASMGNIQETIEQVKKYPRWKMSYQPKKNLNPR